MRTDDIDNHDIEINDDIRAGADIERLPTIALKTCELPPIITVEEFDASFAVEMCEGYLATIKGLTDAKLAAEYAQAAAATAADAARWCAVGGAPEAAVAALIERARELADECVRAAADKAGAVTIEDFHGYMPMHTYIFAPSGQMWPAASVNARIPPVPLRHEDGTPARDGEGKQKKLTASQWLDRNRAVEQMTWAPGQPALIRDSLVSDGGWIRRKGVACFNLYRPPTIELGDPAQVTPWLEHGERLYGDHFSRIVKWLAHRVQRPGEKVNHCLVLGGASGIGKDTLLEPVKLAVGPWNFSDVSARQVLGRFNGFLRSVVLRISEARDLGEVDRFHFYDATKTVMAAPPDVLRIDEKNLREYVIFNRVGVVITTNYKTDGIYLPPDDRRHDILWSELEEKDFPQGYWPKLWGWYEAGGYEDVAAYLAAFDLKGFDPKAPPPKTEAFWAIVNANRAPEEAELQDVIAKMGDPDAFHLARLVKAADADVMEIGLWLHDRKNRRAIPHRLEKCGYAPVRNPDRESGLWVVASARQVIYAKRGLSLAEQIRAAREISSNTPEEIEF